MSTDWKSFADATINDPPRPLLVEAVSSCPVKERALDLGAGALNDSMYLLEQGFEHVTAVDKAPIAQTRADTLSLDHFEYVISSFVDFIFPKEQFNLVNAQYALPFTPPETFSKVFEKIKSSLTNNGVFVGQFFGVKDEWNTSDSQLSFHTKEEVLALVSDMEIIKLDEQEYEGTLVSGQQKHWHVFHVIAKKC